MWRLVLMLLWLNVANAQKKWDGGGGNNLWSDALNWFPDGVPGTSEDVVLDNQWITGNYAVDLPAGLVSTQIRTLRITPSSATITVSLGAANTAAPGLNLTGTGESIIIDDGGILVNASGAASGSPLQLAGNMRLNNGGKYIHRTPRGNAELIDKLVIEQGTEKGIFEFDVPGTSGYTVSLTGNTFGTLVFRASAAGGTKSYSGSGTSNLLIRGDLIIEQGALLTSTLTSDINLGGSLIINGKFNLHPVTAGTTGRSFVFGGKDVVFQGSGTFSMNAFFRNLLVSKNASLTLETPCLLSLTPNTFICQGSLDCKAGYIGGAGSFLLSEDGRIIIRSIDGIWQTAGRGDIRTDYRNFSTTANYFYKGTALQVSGDGIPDQAAVLGINNPAGLILSKPVTVTNSLELVAGNIKTDLTNFLTLDNTMIISPVNQWGNENAGWESSFIDGPVKILTSDSTWKTIPIGAGSQFAPIRLKAADMDDHSMILHYATGAHANTTLLPSLTRISTRGHYITNIGSGKWQIALGIEPAESSLSDSETRSIATLQDINGEWKWGTAGAGLFSNASSGQAGYGWLGSDTAVWGFTALGVGYTINNLLPLELLEFNARNAGTLIELSWRVDQDGKDAAVVIERSADGRSFRPLAEIRSKASRSVSTHLWNDSTPLRPYGYYRLLVKNETTRIYSNMVRVSYTKPKALLYPNPATDWITINFSNGSSDIESEVVNRYGAVLRKLFVKNNLFHIRVSDLSPGFYFVRLRNQGETITLPFTKY